MKKIILYLIKKYQALFSHGVWKYMFFAGGCRFVPTCSEYTYQAVGKYGTIKGLFLGLSRIVRCHPWSRGGLDPLK